MDLQQVGKFVLVFAAAVAVVGVLLIVGGRLGLQSLPGTLKLEGKGWSCFFPIGLSILLTLVLTLVFRLFAGFIGK